MAIRVRCGHSPCRKLLRVQDKLAGKRIKCPACGHATLVPTAEREIPETMLSPTGTEESLAGRPVLVKKANETLLALAGLALLCATAFVVLSLFSLLSWWISICASLVLLLVALVLATSASPRYQCPVCKKNTVPSGVGACRSCRAANRARAEAELAELYAKERQAFRVRVDGIVRKTTGEDTVVARCLALWHPTEAMFAIAENATNKLEYFVYQRGGAEVTNRWRFGYVAATDSRIAFVFCGSLLTHAKTREQLDWDERHGEMVLEEQNVKIIANANVLAEYQERGAGWASGLGGKWGELKLLAPIQVVIWIPDLAEGDRLLAALRTKEKGATGKKRDQESD